MYKIATDLAQRRGRQYWLADLQGNGELTLTKAEQRDSVKAKLQSIEREILSLPKNSPERKELGLIKLELQNILGAMGPKKHATPILGYFYEVARERLPKAQFMIWDKEAHRRAAEAEKLSPDAGGQHGA